MAPPVPEKIRVPIREAFTCPKIHLHGGVDTRHGRLPGDGSGVVGPLAPQQLQPGLTPGPFIQLVTTDQEGSHDRTIGVEHTGIIHLAHPVTDELGPHTQMTSCSART